MFSEVITHQPALNQSIFLPEKPKGPVPKEHTVVFEHDKKLFEWSRRDYQNGEWEEIKRRVKVGAVDSKKVLRTGDDFNVNGDSLYLKTLTVQTAQLLNVFPFKEWVYVSGLQSERTDAVAVRALTYCLEQRKVNTCLILAKVNIAPTLLQPLLSVKNQCISHINVDVDQVPADHVEALSNVLRGCDRLHKVALRYIAQDAVPLTKALMNSKKKLWTLYLDLPKTQDIAAIAKSLQEIENECSQLSQIDLTWGDDEKSNGFALADQLCIQRVFTSCRQWYTPTGLDNMHDRVRSIRPACYGDTHHRRWWSYIYN